MITIVDYGMGNLGSIRNLFRRLGIKTQVSADPDIIKNADRILLPGVGHFSNGAEQLESISLREALQERVVKGGIPLMGICVGHQLLSDGSEEGAGNGLGWIPGECIKLRPIDDAKVPQMGWNYVHHAQEHPILSGLDASTRFYFAHSYWFSPKSDDNILLQSVYGGCVFTAGVSKDNIVGFQFHPEKSHRYGLRLFQNFQEWIPR